MRPKLNLTWQTFRDFQCLSTVLVWPLNVLTKSSIVRLMQTKRASFIHIGISDDFFTDQKQTFVDEIRIGWTYTRVTYQLRYENDTTDAMGQKVGKKTNLKIVCFLNPFCKKIFIVVWYVMTKKLIYINLSDITLQMQGISYSLFILNIKITTCTTKHNL